MQTSALFPWLKYGTVFSLLWILLTQGDLSSWMVGLLLVPLAVWCCLYLFPHDAGKADDSNYGLRLNALFRFMPFFLLQSLKGGWDGALFAIHPRKQLRSGFIRYKTELPPGRPRLFFINTVSLLPGTVSVAMQADDVIIHALDIHAQNGSSLENCEHQIAALFGLATHSATSARKTEIIELARTEDIKTTHIGTEHITANDTQGSTP